MWVVQSGLLHVQGRMAFALMPSSSVMRSVLSFFEQLLSPSETRASGKTWLGGTREMIAPSRSRQIPVLRAAMVSAMACLNAGIELSQWIGV